MSEDASNSPEPHPPAAEPQPTAEPTIPSFDAESWGQASRALVLSVLAGMALVVFAQLSLGGSWVHDFLKKNDIEMEQRMRFIYLLLAGGGALALGGLLPLTLRKNTAQTARVWEEWAWFLSPAILLPAIPVVLHYSVWERRHEGLLPVLLFGALIGEFLLSQSLRHIPAPARRLGAYLRIKEKDDAPEDSPFQIFLERNGALIAVILAALAYGAFMSFYTVRWHQKLGTATFDLGINNNLLYGGLEGRFNQSTVIFPDEPQKYLANHVKIGLYSLLPVYALFPRAETLLILQSVSLGLGAIPLFLFTRRRLPEWWATAIAFCYLAYYPMHGANFYEMKVVPTAAALVLTCIWAIDSKRWITGGLFFVWALIMREDVPVPLAVVGAVFLLSGHRPKAGALMATVATVWFVLIRFRFMNDVGAWWFPNMYEDLWAEPERGFRGVIKTLLSNPAFTLKHIFVEKKFWYLMHLLVPLAFLPLRRWYGWAALVPGAILTLLVTDYAPPILFSFQYVMHWSPYLFLATALVLASMLKAQDGRARALSALTMMCLVSAALSFNYGAFPRRDKGLKSGYHKIEFSFSDKEKRTLQDVRNLIASIPKDASVASTERIGAHLSSRGRFFTLRRGSHNAEYIVARKRGLRLDRTKKTVQEALRSGKYGVDGHFGEFIAFKKGAPTDENDAVIRKWRLNSSKSRRLDKKAREAKEMRLQETEDREEDDQFEFDDPFDNDSNDDAPQDKRKVEQKEND